LFSLFFGISIFLQLHKKTNSKNQSYEKKVSVAPQEALFEGQELYPSSMLVLN